MTQDLQQLLEKINTEGVEKANAEAERIIREANARAKGILDDAARKAGQTTASAEADAEAFERRAEESIRQAARDTLLNVERAVTTLLTKLLITEVNAAMSDSTRVAVLAEQAVRVYLENNDEIDVVTSPDLLNVLRAKLKNKAQNNGVSVETDGRTGTGFKVRVEGGRIEHDFTGPAVADALARGLRPNLAALLK